MKKFLYVFTEEDRDFILSLGYSLIKNDTNNSVFVFDTNGTQITYSNLGNEDVRLEDSNIVFAYSDNLTF